MSKFLEWVLWEDDNFWVINKPTGVSSLIDRSVNASKSVQEYAKSIIPSASLCHRLDKETSGALIISKNEDAYRHMALEFEHRNVHKLYHTWVHGIHNFNEEEINLSIETGKKPWSKISPKGKPSVTLVHSLEHYRNHTKLACAPFTGRKHQIRVHLSYVNAPIIGDEMYGAQPLYLSQLKKKFNVNRSGEEKPIIQRVALHAVMIKFNIPSGQEIEVSAPYPKDIAVLEKLLSKHV